MIRIAITQAAFEAIADQQGWLVGETGAGGAGGLMTIRPVAPAGWG